MNFREPLEAKLKRDKTNIDSAVVDFFYSKPTPIREDDISMYKPHIITELKAFSVKHYGRALGETVLSSAVGSICRKHSQISSSEVKYCLAKIIEEKKLLTFNVHDLSIILKRYEQDKIKVAQVYHEVKANLWKHEEDRKIAYTFLQEAMKKNSEGLHLTIYEKIAIGKHISSNWSKDRIEEVKKEAINSLPKMQERLTKLNDKGFQAHLEDAEMNLPVWWTPDLLFGSLVFENQNK
ncbi:MAG: hypothetical protein ACJASM_003061 [Salibacteraceae bacterium]|jgi:hypothetical protein